MLRPQKYNCWQVHSARKVFPFCPSLPSYVGLTGTESSLEHLSQFHFSHQPHTVLRRAKTNKQHLASMARCTRNARRIVLRCSRKLELTLMASTEVGSHYCTCIKQKQVSGASFAAIHLAPLFTLELRQLGPLHVWTSKTGSLIRPSTYGRPVPASSGRNFSFIPQQLPSSTLLETSYQTYISKTRYVWSFEQSQGRHGQG